MGKSLLFSGIGCIIAIIGGMILNGIHNTSNINTSVINSSPSVFTGWVFVFIGICIFIPSILIFLSKKK
jgi:hypothetical protein